jgi:Zn-dependent peptidase ImmA (M78 family)
MVKLSCRFKNKVPFVRDTVLDNYAERLLMEYDSDCLKYPKPVDYVNFSERYLNLRIEYHNIFSGTDDETILGATSFNDYSKLLTIDEGRIIEKYINRGNIVINQTLIEDNDTIRENSTGLHECSHWFLHQRYYTKNRDQIVMSFMEDCAFVRCCRTNSIDCVKKKLVTEEDFIEHQAGYLGSALAMPKNVFINMTRELFIKYGIKSDHIIIGINKDDDFVFQCILKELTRMFSVSKQAATIRLEKLNFIYSKDDGGVNLRLNL